MKTLTTAGRLVKALTLDVASIPRRHRCEVVLSCGHSCGFKSHDIHRMAAHAKDRHEGRIS